MEPTTCTMCQKEFEPTYIQLWKHRNGKSKHLFCSRTCRTDFYRNSVEMNCAQCGKMVTRPASEFRKSKSGHMFCGRTCAVIWGNYTSKKQTNTSALERFIQEQIHAEYPHLTVKFNDNEAIGAELDIFLVDFKVGIELNGPTHYSPIRGVKKFLSTLANDARKAKMAKQKGILLIGMNIAETRGVGKKAKERYWPQIKNLIDYLEKAQKDKTTDD